jgi:hypothetical protein
MKKYQQLLIIALGLLSFVSFLIYKHEYDRLRHVLQVLEVFGSPPPPQVSVPPLQRNEEIPEPPPAPVESQVILNDV